MEAPHVTKTLRFLFPIALVTLLALAGCANPAEHAPDAEVGEAASEQAPAAEGVRYEIAEGSTISFVGAKVTGKHDGGFNEFSGEITLVDGDPAQSSVRLTIDTTSLWSDNDKLTAHLKSPDFFEVETYPTATFTSTAIAATDTGYNVTGNLNLHGVEKSITFPATIEVGEGQVTAKAEFSIKRFDFGIVYPGPQENLIRDEVLINFDLTATPAAAG